MARNLAAKPLTVTAITAGDELPIVGLTIRSAAEVRAYLLPGPRVTDGRVVPAGYADLICHECGESAAWCPVLADALPVGWGRERDAEIVRYADGGLVTFVV